MNIELKQVHIGQEIKRKLEATELSKTEFGRLIGVQQQHINRILEKDSIDTKRLLTICRALDYNFFALFCQFPTNVNAYLAAVAMGDGPAQNYIGDAALLAQTELLKEKVKGSEEINAALRAQLEDKSEIINLLRGEKK